MAIVVETVSTQNWSTSNSQTITITKPTGLTEGDLMVATLYTVDERPVSTPSGWTAIQGVEMTQGYINQFRKVATAGDVSASNFTFTKSGDGSGTNYLAGVILRITGFSVDNIENGKETDGKATDSALSTSVAFTATTTPTHNKSLAILAFMSANNGSQTSFSGYYTTPSITFTEAFDNNANLGSIDPTSALAYGNYNSASQITEYGATLANAHRSVSGTLLLITAQQDATASNALLQTSPVTFATLTGSTQGATNDFIETSPELNPQSGRVNNQTPWTKTTKPTTNWTKEI